MVDDEVVNHLCKNIGAEKRRSSPYYHEGNGQAERSIQTSLDKGYTNNPVKLRTFHVNTVEVIINKEGKMLERA